MSSRPWDIRLRRLEWKAVPQNYSVRRRVRLLMLLGLPLAVWYFGWLLNPDRVGTPVLDGKNIFRLPDTVRRAVRARKARERAQSSRGRR